MSNELPYLSTLVEGETPEAGERARRAAAQRRYSRRLKRRRAPASDDFARALLQSLRDIVRDVPSSREDQEAFRRLVRGAVTKLLERGFVGEEVRQRVLTTLDPTRPR